MVGRGLEGLSIGRPLWAPMSLVGCFLTFSGGGFCSAMSVEGVVVLESLVC